MFRESLLRKLTDLCLGRWYAPPSPTRQLASLGWRSCLLEVREVPAVVTWDGGGMTNNCSEAANWVGDVLPGNADLIEFDGSVTSKDAVVDGGFVAQVGQLEIIDNYNGSLTIAKDFTVTQSALQDGGTVKIAKDVTFTAANFTIEGASVVNGPGSLNLAAPEGQASNSWAWDGSRFKDVTITTSGNSQGTVESTVDLVRTTLNNGGRVMQNGGFSGDSSQILNHGSYNLKVGNQGGLGLIQQGGPCQFTNDNTFTLSGDSEGRAIVDGWYFLAPLNSITLIPDHCTLQLNLGSTWQGVLNVSALGTLIFSGAQQVNEFVPGVDYQGGGGIEVELGAFLDVVGVDLHITGSLMMTTGLTAESRIRGTGTIGANNFAWTSGAIEIANIHQRTGEVIEVDGATEKRLTNTAFLNEGTFNWRDGDINMQLNATVTTSGTNASFQVLSAKTIKSSRVGVSDFTGRLKFMGGGLLKDNGRRESIKVPVENTGGRSDLGGSNFYAGYAQSDGSTTVSGDILVTGGNLSVTGGTFTANDPTGPDPTIEVTTDANGAGGYFTMTGGTVTLNAADMTADHDVTINGGVFSLQYLSSLTSASVSVNSGATFSAVNGDYVYTANFTNNGLLDLRLNENPYIAILNVYDEAGGSTASFSQGSGASINLGISSVSMYSILDVHGSAAFAGTAYIYKLGGFNPYPNPNNQFAVIAADHLSGSLTWDYSNAAPAMGHWYNGYVRLNNVDYWYIYVGY